MSFQKRRIQVTFRLGTGSFGEGGTNQSSVSGLRISARVVKAGGFAKSAAYLQIYGLTKSKMNTLSTLGMVPTLVRKNTIEVQAGSDERGMSVVFVGTIQNAWMDAKAAPDVAFHVEAFSGLIEAMQPATSNSYRGSTDVATIMSSLATKMGLRFENSGVSVQLADPYLSGSAYRQFESVKEAAGIQGIIDNGVLAIWKTGDARGGSAPLVSKITGLIGYPTYTSTGISFETEFNPSIGFGSKIKMESDLKPANGDWVVYSLSHDLEAEVPKGQWRSQVEAAPPGYTVVH